VACVGGELKIPGQVAGGGGSTAENAENTRASYDGNKFPVGRGEHRRPQCQGRDAVIGQGRGYPLSSSRRREPQSGDCGLSQQQNRTSSKLVLDEVKGEDVIGFGSAGARNSV